MFNKDLNLKIVPANAQGGGVFSYKYPLSKNYFTSFPYNPFRLIHTQLSINAELTVKNKYSLGIGIGNGISSYSYSVPVAIISEIKNGYPTSHYMKLGWIVNSSTTKIPIYINFPLSKKDKIDQSISHSGLTYKKNRTILPFLHLGTSLIKIGPAPETYFAPYQEYDQVILFGDTLTAYTLNKDINYWGVSVDAGINFNYFSQGKCRLRVFIHYDQGLMPLFHLYIVVKENSRIADSNTIISRGSQLKFGLAFPITVYTDKKKSATSDIFTRNKD